MKIDTWVMKIRRRAVLAGIMLLLLNLGITVYADGETEEKAFLSRQFGMVLYRHHKDEGGYCVVVNDVALSADEVKILVDTGELQNMILKRSNPVVRKISNMRQIDTSTAAVHILPVLTLSLSQNIQPQILELEFTHDLQTIAIRSNFYIVEAEEGQTENPQPPSDNTNPEPPGQSEEEQQPPVRNDNMADQPAAEEDQAQYIPLPRIAAADETGTDDQEQAETLSEQQAAEVSEETEDTLTSTEKESIHEPKRETGILKYAFVGTFSLSGIIAVVVGFSIFWDIKALIWNRKKRAEERRKRYCQC